MDAIEMARDAADAVKGHSAGRRRPSPFLSTDALALVIAAFVALAVATGALPKVPW